ncbi:hypothetical protein FHT02_004089 [Sphingomonas xinjiangensis]|uniref:Uncharacterized protein n=1 Tax=Sphingomonas xinjiangensis TaxID=643568 RepID=A0A840YT29_9SPHN|nr:hypothetical protein [Sphingomonas xinjiangensis]MBB5712828.1 hypothetical protein [Sphingomonas xinjiangensis]
MMYDPEDQNSAPDEQAEDMEEAQKDAAHEREENGGYQ